MTNTRDNDTQKHSENLIVFADSGAVLLTKQIIVNSFV